MKKIELAIIKSLTILKTKSQEQNIFQDNFKLAIKKHFIKVEQRKVQINKDQNLLRKFSANLKKKLLQKRIIDFLV